PGRRTSSSGAGAHRPRCRGRDRRSRRGRHGTRSTAGPLRSSAPHPTRPGRPRPTRGTAGEWALYAHALYTASPPGVPGADNPQAMKTERDVLNQPPPLAGYNLFLENRPLVEACAREGADWAHDRAAAFGELLAGEPAEWGRLANESPPKLRTHDRFGNRIDEVEFHPTWHALLGTSVGHGLHALSWREPRPGAHVARAALFALMVQVEAGHTCPVSMTHAAVPALRAQPDLAAEWEPLLTSLEYDPGLRPAAEKRGALCGMAMTERQGGSDLRANTTRAEPLGGGEYELTGHKWFCSAPMCDAFLVLAQAEGGLSCFLLPR